MKKMVFALIIAALCCGPIQAGAVTDAEQDLSTEAIQRLVFPSIREEARKMHGEYTQTDWYDIKIREISHAPTGELLITVEFQPYLGAHISISRDMAVVRAGFYGAAIRDYKVLEKYEFNAPWLPPYR